MGDREREHKDNIWAVTTVVCLKLSVETMHCVSVLTMKGGPLTGAVEEEEEKKMPHSYNHHHLHV